MESVDYQQIHNYQIPKETNKANNKFSTIRLGAKLL